MRKPDTWTHRHARPGYVKLLAINPSVLVTVVMEMMSPRLWSSITFMSEKCSPTYVNVNTKHSQFSGGESLLNQVGLFYCKENISMAKIKIPWNILKMRWGCSPIAPPLPPPMTHIHSCINHCFCIHCIPFKFQYTKYKKFNKP